ncbi:MAG: branched-chain amino acid ABC transporter permease [Syntrophales bacterium]|nr:branched-chain amino acid ABC transporter permease [Syntrophales bacterium]
MDMKRDYYEDVQLFESNVVLFWTVVLLVFLFTLPLYVPSYRFSLFNLVLVHVILAVGLNILVGNTGQISLGHAGFFAIGAYGTTLLMTKLGLPFVLALPLAAFISSAFGFILGLPALRLEGPYLSIATLGFGLTVTHIIGHWDFFGGRTGLQVPPLDLGGGFILKTDVQKYYLILIITIFLVLSARNLLKTRVGRAFVAIRDSDIAAEVIGVNLLIYKTLSFAVSAFYAGIAGGLFGFVLGFFNPEPFNLILSIVFLVMIVVGGLGAIAGSIMGATLITILQYSLLKNIKEVPYVGPFMVDISSRWFTVIGLENLNSIVLGLIMIAIVIFEPLGIYGIWLRIKKYWRTWPF